MISLFPYRTFGLGHFGDDGRIGGLEWWNSGIMEDWNGGMMEDWNGGRLERWKVGSVTAGFYF